MDSIERIIKAYRQNPVEGMEIERISNPSGVRFTCSIPDNAPVAVEISHEGTPWIKMSMTRDHFASNRDIKYLKGINEKMYRVICAAINDLKIMALQAECCDSLVFRDSFNAQMVETRMKDWEETTGRIAPLTEEQKAALYNGLLKNEPYSTTVEISGWLKDNDIPSVHTGSITLRVDKQYRNIKISGCIDQIGADTEVSISREFELDTEHDLGHQFTQALEEIHKSFDIGTQYLGGLARPFKPREVHLTERGWEYMHKSLKNMDNRTTLWMVAPVNADSCVTLSIDRRSTVTIQLHKSYVLDLEG